ncbi:MAG: hypothetical protein ABI877_20565 [Gemmatimonadaceae bacterium]
MLQFADTRRGHKYLLAALLSFAVGARGVGAQEKKAQLGLRAAGGLGVFVGGGRAIHDLPGGEGGALLDLGWVWSPRVRLVGDASWFIGSLHEFVEQDDEHFSGPVFDLSSTVSLMALSGSATARQTAYASFGVSIHALSSSFNSIPLDQRYNANRFGVAAAIGGRVWVGPEGTRALFTELRGTSVSELHRWTIRAGFIHNFRPLTRPARR